ncbi:hypothetical protein [Flavobacterium sp. 1355]|uniref:hypothetical protein n=1 Tax=Flavobacterium sp. 1355 TaxID=2806571 RepID=UPI001AEA2DB6|nr:hypothetical protein [Flavobacterium sp. 1355]MBP1222419.1 hypothetical protein [Flavobacterium sp. 1355]
MMITDNYTNYNSYEGNFITEDQNQQPIGDESSFEELRLSDQNYVDSEFSNALEPDDQDDLEQDYQENELEEENLEDLEDDDDAEYDENDWEEEEDDDSDEKTEPETFTDDSLKID